MRRAASPDALEAELRELLDARYHHRHPFNRRMHAGELAPEEIRSWVRNRYYYQTRIPVKDGLIVAKEGPADFRRAWGRRIVDHQGGEGAEGGLALWLRLASAVGLDPERVAAAEDVLPGVRRACDAYVEFVEEHALLESVAASLTELYAGALLGARAEAFERHYPWIGPEGLAYFRSRTVQAPRDAEEGLAYVREHATTGEAQARCVAALERKCAILWELLDGVEWARTRLRPSPHAALREEAGGAAVAALPERAVRLDARARAILGLCDGTRDAEAVAAALRAEHPEAEGVERDVYAFLEDMQRAGVLEPAEGAP